MQPIFPLPVLVVLGLLALPVLRAAETAPDARLRENLRTTTVQLRDTQGQLATLQAASQAAKDESDQKIKLLTKQVEELIKNARTDKDAADKALAALKAGAAMQAEEFARIKDELARTKAAGDAAAALAAAKETERARLEAANLVLERTVADREAKNLALFKTGNEILTRYEKFGLGEALAAKEPFVGTTRVRLENLVQGYQDKLLDQRAKP